MIDGAFLDDIRGKMIPAVPVPFDASGNIEQDLQAQYIDWMCAQDIGGVATWAHTGRGLWLSRDERDSVLEAWRAGRPARRIVCGVGVPHATVLPDSPRQRTQAVLEETLTMARDAKVGGAHGLLAYPPRGLAKLPDAEARILEYHEAVADVGLPVIAFYLYEAAGGVPYSMPLLESVLRIRNLVGVKVATLDSVMTFQDVAAHVVGSDALLVTGEDRFLGYTYMLGAESALVGIAAAATDKCISLLDAWTSKDLERFHGESGAMDAFAMATFRHPMEGYVQRMLWAAEMDGVLTGEAIDRHAPRMDEKEKANIRAAVHKLRGR